MFVPAPPHPPSAEARELGGLITQLVQDYQAEHPGMSGRDALQAIEIARQELRSAPPATTRLAILLAIGLGMAAVVGFQAFSGGRRGGPSITWMILAVGIAVTILGLVAAGAAIRRR